MKIKKGDTVLVISGKDRWKKSKILQVFPKENRVIVDKTIELPRGTLSKDREIKILLPRNSEDLTEEIRNTEFGKYLINYIEKKNLENNLISSLREQRDRQEIIRLLHGGGELSVEEIHRRNELLEEVARALIKEKERERER